MWDTWYPVWPLCHSLPQYMNILNKTTQHSSPLLPIKIKINWVKNIWPIACKGHNTGRSYRGNNRNQRKIGSSMEETNAPPMLLSKTFAQSQYKLSFKGFLEHWIECRQQGEVQLITGTESCYAIHGRWGHRKNHAHLN